MKKTIVLALLMVATTVGVTASTNAGPWQATLGEFVQGEYGPELTMRIDPSLDGSVSAPVALTHMLMQQPFTDGKTTFPIIFEGPTPGKWYQAGYELTQTAFYEGPYWVLFAFSETVPIWGGEGFSVEHEPPFGPKEGEILVGNNSATITAVASDTMSLPIGHWHIGGVYAVTSTDVITVTPPANTVSWIQPFPFGSFLTSTEVFTVEGGWLIAFEEVPTVIYTTYLPTVLKNSTISWWPSGAH